MTDILITEFMEKAAVEDLEGDFTVHFDPELWTRPDDIAARVGEARGLIVRNRTQVTAALLEQAPKLKVVGRLGVGLDNIDLDACAARTVAVCPATGANSASVAEYVIAAMLMLFRGVFRANDRMLAGDWPRESLIGVDATGRTLGVLGFGAIGQAVATRARALGMRVIAHDAFLPEGDPGWELVASVSLDRLIAESDALTVHVPLTPETSGLIGRDAFAAMRPGAVLIDTARGGVVDEEALAEALRTGRLRGAALDVFETEPLTAEAAARFADVPNLILTPHIAGITEDSNARVGAITAENVRRHLLGDL